MTDQRFHELRNEVLRVLVESNRFATGELAEMFAVPRQWLTAISVECAEKRKSASAAQNLSIAMDSGKWTAEQVRFIQDCDDMALTDREMTKRFNRQLGTNKTSMQIGNKKRHIRRTGAK